ncbi:MAG TPA: tagaturonate epimerase family protein [Herpetosiphonaceae bacterium]|nr:tagaturonate epimerase family protein [Herpetosiphonaceae bacterium]
MNESNVVSTLVAVEHLSIAPGSSVMDNGVEYALARMNGTPQLVVQASDGSSVEGFEGALSEHEGRLLLLGPCNAHNAAALRDRLPWLRPQPLGLQTSAGMGDRLGLATPGHVRAVRAVGGNIAPIFPQQSIREMTRTGRTAQQVMDEAMWGVFAEGWRDGFGADADHLKTPVDIDTCVAAGYTFFTIDPGEYVDDRAETATSTDLHTLFEALPWSELEDAPADLLRRYGDQALEIEDHTIRFDEATAVRAAAKYGRAIAHVARMYRHLQEVAGDRPTELEVSVDETEYVTTHAEHVYIAAELQRLGVRWVSLAPRYVGHFEKGVDYIGDLGAFEDDFAVHAAIARHYGPYKLSLHSGSDKFSVYPIAVRQTRGLVHLKTAGTSYLEALRTIAELDPALFRAIYTFARDRYETDKASYHVSAELQRAPRPEDMSDADLPELLTQFDAREILHVTFGSVLTTRTEQGGWLFYDRLMALLRANPEAYAKNLEAHFVRHLQPFAVSTGAIA